MTTCEDRTIRAKAIYPRYKLSDSVFRVGAQRGLTIELTDPTQMFWTLLNVLDGSRSIRQVIEEMQKNFPSLSQNDIRVGIERLDTEGLLEDATPSIYDVEDAVHHRYVGNVNYFSHFVHSNTSRGAHQDQLLSSRVVLFGLGDGGSNILQLLVAIGFGSILAVDYDIVELSNLNRQVIYAPEDVGRMKTEVSKVVTSRIAPHSQIEFVNEKITEVDQINALIHEADMVICAMDEPPMMIQRLVNRACVQKHIPCVYGISQTSRARVFSVIPGSGCLDCLHLHYAIKDPNFSTQFQALHRLEFESPPIAFVPNVMRLATEIADEAVRIITGYLPPLSIARQIEIDFETMNTSVVVEWSRNTQDCPACGEGDESVLAALLDVAPLRKHVHG